MGEQMVEGISWITKTGSVITDINLISINLKKNKDSMLAKEMTAMGP